MSDAPGQGGNKSGVATLWFGPEHDVVMVASFRHKPSSFSQWALSVKAGVSAEHSELRSADSRGRLSPHELLRCNHLQS